MQLIDMTSDRTDLSTESGSGPIQLVRARYRSAGRSVAESPPHCMNAPQHTWPIKSAVNLGGVLGGGRSVTDIRTGDAPSPN